MSSSLSTGAMTAIAIAIAFAAAVVVLTIYYTLVWYIARRRNKQEEVKALQDIELADNLTRGLQAVAAREMGPEAEVVTVAEGGKYW